MTDINVTVMCGRLSQDAIQGKLADGTDYAKCTIAVNREFKKDGNIISQPSFFNFALFGKFAALIGQYLKKGTPVSVRGYFRQDTWEKDGEKRVSNNFICETLQLFGKFNKDATEKTENANEPVTTIQNAIPDNEIDYSIF